MILNNMNLINVYNYINETLDIKNNINIYSYKIDIVTHSNEYIYINNSNKYLYEIFNILFNINQKSKYDYIFSNNIISQQDINFIHNNTNIFLKYIELICENSDWENRIKYAQINNTAIDARIQCKINNHQYYQTNTNQDYPTNNQQDYQTNNQQDYQTNNQQDYQTNNQQNDQIHTDILQATNVIKSNNINPLPSFDDIINNIIEVNNIIETDNNIIEDNNITEGNNISQNIYSNYTGIESSIIYNLSEAVEYIANIHPMSLSPTIISDQADNLITDISLPTITSKNDTNDSTSNISTSCETLTSISCTSTEYNICNTNNQTQSKIEIENGTTSKNDKIILKFPLKNRQINTDKNKFKDKLHVSKIINSLTKTKHFDLWYFFQKCKKIKINKFYPKYKTKIPFLEIYEYNLTLDKFIKKLILYSLHIDNLNLNHFINTNSQKNITNESLEESYKILELSYNIPNSYSHVRNFKKIITLNHAFLNNILNYVMTHHKHDITINEILHYKRLKGCVPIYYDNVVYCIKTFNFKYKSFYSLILYGYLLYYCKNINIRKFIIFNPLNGYEFVLEKNINYQKIDMILNTL